jgi:asparagine synthase (glutamine-hydrolysing)
MCGILGFASELIVKDKEKYLSGSRLLNHRGPDDSGEWFSEDGCVGLGHRRLSIVDISANGHQPMSSINDELIIVFNGEIYNYIELSKTLSEKGYKFKSKTDTEVILAAYSEWGEECTNFLNGMFAFAIYDSINKNIFISRDRAGEKPIYYQYHNGIFHFASELKGLVGVDSFGYKINNESLDCFLSMGFVPGDRCILDGFNKLPAAHSLIFSLEDSSITITNYWELPVNKKNNHSALELSEELDELLDNSVKLQLMADVPVGILLSGGVDSSLITAMAARHTNHIKTFNVRFPGQGRFDETEHARKISQHFDTEHIELEASPVDVDLLIKLARQFDEPIVDSSMIPMFMVSELVQKHCKVVLGGDGGDELFGGYQHYSRLLWMNKYYKFIPLLLRQSAAFIADKTMPSGMKGKNWIQSLRYDLNIEVPLIANYFDPMNRKKLMQGSFSDWPLVAEDILNFRTPKNKDLLQRSTRMDFYNYLAEDILVKVDRASMLNSLEIRAPFLDRHLIEFAFKKVPSHLKATSKNKKILLKNLTQKVLPTDFDHNRKQGFSIPINEWLKKGKFRDFFYNILLDPQTIFDRKTVEKLLKYQDMGFNNGERLFALLMFELWRREYKVSY